MVKKKVRVAILGGGPSGMFMYKQFVESEDQHFHITIFEKTDRLGAGMPYSKLGACNEHITNVSDNEIPELHRSIKEWLPKAPQHLLSEYNITPENFNEYKVLPRLFFGAYLEDQFSAIRKQAAALKIETEVFLKTTVHDIIETNEGVKVILSGRESHEFDSVIISTGHVWPKNKEGVVPGFFESPYPPAKLALKVDYPVALKGAALTAIDAVRTLARANGKFEKHKDTIQYRLDDDSNGFRIVMHSRSGLLPAIRFHLDDSHLSKDSVIPPEEMFDVMQRNDGFVTLDYLFERNFKQPFREKDPEFYESIRKMDLETFVEHIMRFRETIDPFLLFKAEYDEAEKSIRRKKSVQWKEMLAVLSFALNYPAKHFSAEDMLRLQKTLMPLISIVIAFVPQTSCLELLALHDAGVLELIGVGPDSNVEAAREGADYFYTDEDGMAHKDHYKLYIDCTGQKHLSYADFPFQGLKESGTVSAARLLFRSDETALREIKNGNTSVSKIGEHYYLDVPGLAISDAFQAVDRYGAYSEKIYIMAVPYIGGFNPDYSGLDFGEEASGRIYHAIAQQAARRS